MVRNLHKTRRLLVIVVALVTAGIATRLAINWFNEHETRLRPSTDNEIAEATRRVHATMAPVSQDIAPVQDIEPSKQIRLAIGCLGFPDEATNRQLVDLVTAELTQARSLELVDRQSLDKVLQELGLSFSGLTRARDAVHAGKLLRADWFLLGSAPELAGKRSCFIRIVDTRTGIIRDVAVLNVGSGPLKLAGQIAAFVRQCRDNKAPGANRVYLALGGLKDLSVNNRRADFPNQLRSYLTAAYSGSSITMLERDQVSALQNEIYLDLAGLTDTAEKNPTIHMQSAFWVIDGYYQSLENVNLEVETELTIRRMFGRNRRIALHGETPEPLFSKIKASLDAALADRAAVAIPTRVTEVKAQLGAGLELANIEGDHVGWTMAYNTSNPEEIDRQRRNLEEAVRAFQTVLLLEPTNRAAKLYIAACLSYSFMDQPDQAREYYRQLVEEEVEDHWSASARQGLVGTLWGWPPEQRIRWFTSAAGIAHNPAVADFYLQQAKAAAEDAALAQGGSKALEIANKRMLAAMKHWYNQCEGHMFGIDFDNNGFRDYVEFFGTNSAAAAHELVALLPELQRAVPQLAPHILAGVATYQVDTNAPIIKEFERSMSNYVAHPDQLYQPRYYFALLSSPVRYWAESLKLHGMVAEALDARLSASHQKYAEPLDSEQMMSLAFAHLQAEHWQSALEMFQVYSNRPVQMGNSGPWGRAFSPVFPSKKVNLCREKLGLQVLRDPKEFSFGEPCFTLPQSGVFATDPDGVWLAVDSMLLHLNSDMMTNIAIDLPTSHAARCIALAPGRVWVGTEGGGLLEISTTTRECRHLTESDGLLMNYVSALHKDGKALWIGYGSDTAGGLGQLDLITGKITSYSPSLTGQQVLLSPNTGEVGLAAPNAPPRLAVGAISTDSNGMLWFTERGHLRRFRQKENEWSGVPEAPACMALALSEDRVFASCIPHSLPSATNDDCLGIAVGDLRNGDWRYLRGFDSLPLESVTAIRTSGPLLYIGGMGFISLIAPQRGELLKYAYIDAPSVDRIELNAGFLWAQAGRRIYRMPLSQTQ